jgi:hypothetical protein
LGGGEVQAGDAEGDDVLQTLKRVLGLCRWARGGVRATSRTRRSHTKRAGSSTGGLAKEVGRKGEAIGKTLEEGARLEQVD